MRSRIEFLKRYVKKFGNYPIHFSLCYLFNYLFGTLPNKIRYDIFRLPHYAFGIFEAANRAKELGINKMSVIEFGVANGRGLLGMVSYAKIVSEYFGVKINVIGFDSGEGMPKHEGYQDHPELYVQGDFPMQDQAKLKKLLPEYATLIVAKLNFEDWTRYIPEDAPIGFISIDVDYYSSTNNLLQHLKTVSFAKLLPNSLFYLDDVSLDNHNPFQGELLAINNFNRSSEMRKFEQYFMKLKHKQKFYNEPWLDQIFQFHCFDHPIRSSPYRDENGAVRILGNKYLGLSASQL